MRVLFDDLGVVRRVGDGRRPGLDRDQDRRAADGLEQTGALELLGHRDRIDGLATGVQRADRLEDVLVRRPVEVLRVEPLDRVGDRLGAEHHRPEQRLLRLQVVGRNAHRADARRSSSKAWDIVTHSGGSALWAARGQGGECRGQPRQIRGSSCGWICGQSPCSTARRSRGRIVGRDAPDDPRLAWIRKRRPRRSRGTRHRRGGGPAPGVGTERLDVLVEVDRLAIELDAGLRRGSASATSAAVIEPKSLPPSPARAEMLITFGTSTLAISSARLAVLRVLQHALATHGRGLGLDAGRGREAPAPGARGSCGRSPATPRRCRPSCRHRRRRRGAAS